MGQHYLSALFSPRSVAVIGASERPDSVGEVVFRNLLENGYRGELYPVNPAHERIQGRRAYATLEEIGAPVELAVICTRAATVPEIIEACGRQQVRAAVVLSAGFSEIGADGAELERMMLTKARIYGVRILGPNCLGLMRTRINLDAAFFRGEVVFGNLALVSQSGALCTAILDWASARGIGFSSVVSMGTSADVDFGDVLDYLATDTQTQSILIYVEGIHKARSFMSALRAAARSKPIFVMKVGRHAAGSEAVMSHTGAMVGDDDVFDAALSRAGVVRVKSIGGLFSAAQSLASRYRYSGDRLAIITNGGGPGVMAVDRAVDLGVTLAGLAETSIAALNRSLPATWSHANPVDILGDATSERYCEALKICMADPGVDGVLVILTPRAMTRPRDVARALLNISRDFNFNKPLLACWMGDTQVEEGHALFSAARIPAYHTPENAVEAFSFMTAFYRNQQQLMQVPGPLAHHDEPDVDGARLLIESALAEQRTVLSELESKALLAAFRIPVTRTVIARSPNEALMLAEELGLPVAMKINSPDVAHKSDVGGVKLNLGTAAAVRGAYEDIMASVLQNRPDARRDGVMLQPMVIRANGRELMMGVTSDAVFGPVITFGAGGVAVEVLGDRAVALPPLNSYLARELIGGTRIARLLGRFRHMPPVDIEALENILLRVSEMVCELPWLKEMDINPLIADETGALAVDARVVVEPVAATAERYSHMAVHPYPMHLVSHWQLSDGTDICIRPIRPEDAESEQAFVRELSDEAKYFRFMSAVHELSHAMLVRFTQIDYDREMALLALTEQDGHEVQIGVCRYIINPDGTSCEFALVVSDRWQRRAIGQKLMNCLMDIARVKGLKTMEGEVLASNASMLKLVAALGFIVKTSADDPNIKCVSKTL